MSHIGQRASQSIALAPPASMIDPAFESNRLQASQLPHGFAFPPSQSHPPIMNGRANTPSTQDPSDRVLPSIEITDESIDQAYVDFIYYCNPSVPSDTNPAELKKNFRAPPQSDSKKFSPFKLYGLISKLENKDIKTWAQLVVDLGVELPDPAKNQSAQKVQQYAVRLKRWLHAYHIDAFFHYCLNIPNSYYTERPSKDQPLADIPRDGVPPEEDLALRSLLPELRPKRGRRKAEDGEEDNNPAKKVQHQRSTSAEFFHGFDDQYSAHPSNVIPWSAQPQQPDAWAAAQMAVAPKTPSTGRTPSTAQMAGQDAVQHLRWRVNEGDNTPMTPYPQSAVTPRHHYSTSPSFEEPKSANPAGLKSRSRKRHGPAVSSAWSNASTSSGKLRGRPPSNRSVTDGPFSTFPANPSARGSPHPGMDTTTPKLTSPPDQNQHAPATPLNSQPTIMVTPQSATAQQALARRPSKLQLQVPEHAGGPVRLATPPRVLINGETDRQNPSTHERRSSADFFNQLDDGSELDDMEDQEGSISNIDWKRRALTLKKKLQEKEEELKAMKRRVLEAVM
ncbi:MAG: hypothetical protein LQ343_007442 [Gyalolechia ehrenbergii]|nr:MAG: hypothetical protein LQ343_007442 [Gyalolechia ehrenbergii]